MQNPEFLMSCRQIKILQKNTKGHLGIESPIALLKNPQRIQLVHTYIQNVFTTQHVFVMTLVYAGTRTSSAAFWALD